MGAAALRLRAGVHGNDSSAGLVLLLAAIGVVTVRVVRHLALVAVVLFLTTSIALSVVVVGTRGDPYHDQPQGMRFAPSDVDRYGNLV